MPKVGLFCFETSGLLMSRPPGVFSQATTPHMLPLHCATRMLATPSATLQSPVGSSASAGARPVAKNNPEYRYATHDVSWAVQHGSNLCLMDDRNEGKTPH